jgi:hypothetical protein
LRVKDLLQFSSKNPYPAPESTIPGTFFIHTLPHFLESPVREDSHALEKGPLLRPGKGRPNR